MTRFLIGGLCEAWDVLRSFLTSLTRPKPTLSVVEYRKSDKRKFAIFCLFDQKPRPDLRALFSNLADAGFRIVGVAPNGALDQYEGLLDIAVHVSPVGRDFFAYQQGWRALDGLGLKQEVEEVCFCKRAVVLALFCARFVTAGRYRMGVRVR